MFIHVLTSAVRNHVISLQTIVLCSGHYSVKCDKLSDLPMPLFVLSRVEGSHGENNGF
jgi:hypothetical protein